MAYVRYESKMCWKMTCLFVFLEQIVRESIDHSRHSYDHVSNWRPIVEFASGIAVVCCSTTRQFEGFCERAENALMPYARSKPRVVFPRSTPTIQRNSARNCGPESHGHQLSVCLCPSRFNFQLIEILILSLNLV